MSWSLSCVHHSLGFRLQLGRPCRMPWSPQRHRQLPRCLPRSYEKWRRDRLHRHLFRDGRCMSMLLSFSNWNLRRLDWQNQNKQLTEPVFEIGFCFEFTWSGREISVDINHDFLSLKRQIFGDTHPSLSFNPLTSMQNSSKFRSPSPSSADCYIIEWYRMAVSAVCADIQETLAFKV